MNLRDRIILTVAAYPLLVYAVAYGMVWISPYWYDGKPDLEYIPVSERWSFALIIWWFLMFYGLPLLFGVIALISYLYKRKNPPRS
jgi:hypothetical protein